MELENQIEDVGRKRVLKMAGKLGASSAGATSGVIVKLPVSRNQIGFDLE